MKVVAAYLLAQLGGNAAPSAGDITKILSAGAWGGGARMGHGRRTLGSWAAHGGRMVGARATGCCHAPSSPRRRAVNCVRTPGAARLKRIGDAG
jgi:hypothetical protein